jgi:hypothetical protein
VRNADWDLAGRRLFPQQSGNAHQTEASSARLPGSGTPLVVTCKPSLMSKPAPKGSKGRLSPSEATVNVTVLPVVVIMVKEVTQPLLSVSVHRTPTGVIGPTIASGSDAKNSSPWPF